jgi:E3 ubiquitin-protein ligase Hakai
MVACPDHLVLADLPVAKGIGAATAASLVKTVGRRSRRPLGDRVHFCVRCDFPIAIYGRLVLTKHNCSILPVASQASVLRIFPFQ